MDIQQRYLAYAAAFEESYSDGNWQRLAQFFSDDAVYEAGPDDRVQGRDAVLGKFRDAVGGFDQRMDSRTPDFQPPSVEGNRVTMSWQVTYTLAGCPDLVISGTETADFDGERIAVLRDSFDPRALAAMQSWMAAHGERLAPD